MPCPTPISPPLTAKSGGSSPVDAGGEEDAEGETEVEEDGDEDDKGDIPSTMGKAGSVSTFTPTSDYSQSQASSSTPAPNPSPLSTLPPESSPSSPSLTKTATLTNGKVVPLSRIQPIKKKGINIDAKNKSKTQTSPKPTLPSSSSSSTTAASSSPTKPKLKSGMKQTLLGFKSVKSSALKKVNKPVSMEVEADLEKNPSVEPKPKVLRWVSPQLGEESGGGGGSCGSLLSGVELVKTRKRGKPASQVTDEVETSLDEGEDQSKESRLEKEKDIKPSRRENPKLKSPRSKSNHNPSSSPTSSPTKSGRPQPQKNPLTQGQLQLQAQPQIQGQTELLQNKNGGRMGYDRFTQIHRKVPVGLMKGGGFMRRRNSSSGKNGVGSGDVELGNGMRVGSDTEAVEGGGGGFDGMEGQEMEIGSLVQPHRPPPDFNPHQQEIEEIREDLGLGDLQAAMILRQIKRDALETPSPTPSDSQDGNSSGGGESGKTGNGGKSERGSPTKATATSSPTCPGSTEESEADRRIKKQGGKKLQVGRCENCGIDEVSSTFWESRLNLMKPRLMRSFSFVVSCDWID